MSLGKLETKDAVDTIPTKFSKYNYILYLPYVHLDVETDV